MHCNILPRRKATLKDLKESKCKMNNNSQFTATAAQSKHNFVSRKVLIPICSHKKANTTISLMTCWSLRNLSLIRWFICLPLKKKLILNVSPISFTSFQVFLFSIAIILWRLKGKKKYSCLKKVCHVPSWAKEKRKFTVFVGYTPLSQAAQWFGELLQSLNQRLMFGF